MNSGSEIRYCTAKVDAYNTDGYGGGIMINGGEKPGVFTMNGGEIHNCTAVRFIIAQRATTAEALITVEHLS